MKTPARFVLLVLGTFIAAAALMAPRREEWVAILQAEGNQARVISLLEPRLAHDPDDPDLLATLARTYAESSALDRAIGLLKRYITLRPGDGGAYGRLADLYKKSGDLPGQIAMLKRSVAIKPELSRVSELAAAYRQTQHADEELALLSQFERELTVDDGSLLRLAQLRDGVADVRGAIETLTRPGVVSDPPRGEQQAETRLFLFKELFEAGRNAEAIQLGKQWILQWHEPWLAGRLLGSVAVQASVADTSQLADAVVASHPEIRLFLVQRLAAMGAKPVARHLLETWVEANPSPSKNEIAAFLSGCREQDELAIAWQAFSTVVDGTRSKEIVTRFAEAMAATFGIGALAPFWSSLPPAIIADNPLLGAQLAFHEGDLTTTIWLLNEVEFGSLTESDRRIWIDLLTAAASPRDAFAILRDRRLAGGLPSDLLDRYARLAGELGEDVEFRAALARIGRAAR